MSVVKYQNVCEHPPDGDKNDILAVNYIKLLPQLTGQSLSYLCTEFLSDLVVVTLRLSGLPVSVICADADVL